MFAGAEAKLSFSSGPDGYVYVAQVTPAALAASVAALIVYLVALTGSDRYAASSDVAGLLRRFGAFLLDFLLCGLLVIPVSASLALLLEGAVTGAFAFSVRRDEALPHDIAGHALVLVNMVVVLVLFALPLARQRRSAGAILCNLSVVPAAPLGLERACLRTLLGFVTLAAALISVPMALSRADKRLWHDLAFDTPAVIARSPSAHGTAD